MLKNSQLLLAIPFYPPTISGSKPEVKDIEKLICGTLKNEEWTFQVVDNLG